MIRKVLIVNRGEIAVRIARTCREMGIKTVGVYSEADRGSLHVECMDEAYLLGPAPAAESYLRQDKLIGVARESGADAVHPGYGFLSENAAFAHSIQQAQLIWIGPPPKAIKAMGSKTAARELMKRAGIPVVPGSDGEIRSVTEAKAFAKAHDFPILLKAAAGGGGKGMRIARDLKELESGFDAAKREATAAFGDGTLYVEKYIEQPRHIEFQVFADQHGHVIHLGERECSLQRRHQKIIEESPSAVMTTELREAMGRTAVAAAKASGYVNAGTVEMLMDATGKFYFLEMNTRLQVEHPVTEEVMGVDLVRWQLQVASGGELPLTQEEVSPRGHAIEVRIYAEDVASGFLPSTGVLRRLRPATGPGVREDSGMREGAKISRFYDPMISKLIAKGETREAARSRMLRALEDYEISGVRTNISFARHIIASESFRDADFHTRSVDDVFLESFEREHNVPAPDEEILVAALAKMASESDDATNSNHRGSGRGMTSNWKFSGRQGSLRSGSK